MNEEKLTFEELEFLLKRLSVFMKNWGIKNVSFDAKDDLYFKVWHEDREFTPEFIDRPKYLLQSVSEDVAELRRLLDLEETPTTVDLERIGAVLTVLGATMLDKADLSEK
jgi:hypothetical protein